MSGIKGLVVGATIIAGTIAPVAPSIPSTVERSTTVTSAAQKSRTVHIGATGSGSRLVVTIRPSVQSTPVATVDASQQYYWTETWQRNERASEAEINSGQGVHFDNVDDLFRWLDAKGE